MKRKPSTEQGFLLLSCLIVFAAIVAVIVLSLDLSRQLWKASQIELSYSAVQNTQRAALTEIQGKLQTNTIPAACWHYSLKPWLSVDVFEREPERGCTFNWVGGTHYYWLEVLSEQPNGSQVLVHYQLSLISQMDGFSVEAQSYGVAYKTVEPSTKGMIR